MITDEKIFSKNHMKIQEHDITLRERVATYACSLNKTAQFVVFSRCVAAPKKLTSAAGKILRVPLNVLAK